MNLGVLGDQDGLNDEGAGEISYLCLIIGFVLWVVWGFGEKKSLEGLCFWWNLVLLVDSISGTKLY